MCGICGIYNFDSGKKVKEFTLREMAEAIKHRGPDDEGFYIDGNLGFGHKRLSIIDLSSAAHLPMSNEDGTVWITYNGEIYNYLELRRELIDKGHNFKSHSDTEVIIHLYEEEGEKCLKKFNGMFSFVLWDKRKKKLFAARDRLGIKPFYYHLNKERFVFASEIKSLLRSGIRAEVNLEAINNYLTYQFCLGEKTFFKGVKKLEPGHCLVIKNRDLKISKYWELGYNACQEKEEGYLAENLLGLIQDSVRIQLRSDVPLGAHLSGGLDTSIVACLASKLSNENSGLKTFTGFFPFGKEYDEREYARTVSEFAKTNHFETSPNVDNFINILPKLIYFMDEPAGGPGLFPQYFVSKLAAEKVKLVLGGQGGDEVWGGYTRYLVAYLEQALKGAILGTQEEGEYVVTLKSILPNLGILENYTPTLQYFWQEGVFGPMDERYFRLVNRNRNLDSIFSSDFLEEVKANNSSLEEFKNLFNYPETPSYFNKMTHFDLKTLLPALLHVEDRMSMAVSLESRVPLLDHRIVEFSAGVSPVVKFKGGESKHLLKLASKNTIPREILNRKDKIGFAVPLSSWYREEKIQNFLRETLLSKRARERGIYSSKGIEKLIGKEKKFGRQIWGLLCLELWFRNFIDSDYETRDLS